MRKNGFTLIELMIVIAILGIIVVCSAPHVLHAVDNPTDGISTNGHVVDSVQITGTKCVDGKRYDVDSRGALHPTNMTCQ